MKNILITGGTGLIGNKLSKILSKKGYNIRCLSRKNNLKKKNSTYLWNPEKEFIDLKSLNKLYGIIHLAGYPLYNGKWNIQKKKKILQSRSKTAFLLWKYIIKFKKKLKFFISASGINYYGSITQEKPFTEKDPPGKDFLSKVCQKWENSVNLFQKINVRTVKLRTGIVLSKDGGALKKIEKIIKYYLGGPLNNGNHFMPWIHIDDLCRLYVKVIEEKNWEGSYNAVSPEIINNLEFTKLLAKQIHKPLFFSKIPIFILKIIYGKELANILVNGSPISAQKIIKKGFIFKYPKLINALQEIYSI